MHHQQPGYNKGIKYTHKKKLDCIYSCCWSIYTYVYGCSANRNFNMPNVFIAFFEHPFFFFCCWCLFQIFFYVTLMNAHKYNSIMCGVYTVPHVFCLFGKVSTSSSTLRRCWFIRDKHGIMFRTHFNFIKRDFRIIFIIYLYSDSWININVGLCVWFFILLYDLNEGIPK